MVAPLCPSDWAFPERLPRAFQPSSGLAFCRSQSIIRAEARGPPRPNAFEEIGLPSAAKLY
jgi:hypothetical protein